jgi:hypothetical protein
MSFWHDVICISNEAAELFTKTGQTVFWRVRNAWFGGVENAYGGVSRSMGDGGGGEGSF